MNNTSIMATAATLIAVLLTTVIGLPEVAGAQGSSAETKRSESPFACNRLAFTPEQRKRHFDELGPKLVSLRWSVRELPNGYEFEFPADANTLQLVSEWAIGERACCPFFEIDMRLEREGGSLWLALTGREGVKQFIQADGAAWIRQVMRTKIAVLPATATLGEISQSLRTDHHQEQRLLPVVNAEGHLVGVLTRQDISERLGQKGDGALRLLGEVARTDAIEAYPDEPLRVVVYRMAEKGVTRMPVVERTARTFLGLISLNDLLKARTRHLEEERRRERTLKFRFFFPGKRDSRDTGISEASKM